MHLSPDREADYTCVQVFRAASTWLERNHQHNDFYLHIDCFPPHEPLDPPEEILRQFWPTGYEGIDPSWRAGVESWPTETWLSDKASDPNELHNLADSHPDQLATMQRALVETLQRLGAPEEQTERLGLA